jgi:hypothetical protein
VNRWAVLILTTGRRGKYNQRKGVIKQRNVYDVGIKGEEEKVELKFTLEQTMKTHRGIEL